MALKFGSVVEGVGGALKPGHQYVVHGRSVNGGFWVQDLADGSLPVVVAQKRQALYPFKVEEVVRGFLPRELQEVGQFHEFARVQPELALVA
jgi:hypothetical protein